MSGPRCGPAVPREASRGAGSRSRASSAIRSTTPLRRRSGLLMSIDEIALGEGSLVVGALAVVRPLPGCGSSNPNEREFLESAPPGKPPENPDEKVSQRRSRTQNSKQAGR